MMKEYLMRSGQRDNVGQLDKLCDQLQQTSTREEVGRMFFFHFVYYMYSVMHPKFQKGGSVDPWFSKSGAHITKYRYDDTCHLQLI